MAGRLLRLAAIAATAITAAFVLYGATLHYGFHYDDYYFIKPYSRAEVLATFSDSWDHSGIMVPFYRPLTIAFYALRFDLFGLNAVAHHAVSLTLFALCATLAGALAARMTGMTLAGVIAALTFAVHPAMPYAQAAWITNQMHLLSSLIVLSGLLWWHWVASKSLAWWLPLLVFAVAAFMVKEDNIMLLPAVITLHWLRRRLLDRTLTPVPRAFVVSAAAVAVGLILLRHEALGVLGGYGRPTPERAWLNFQRGITGVFWLRPAHRPWQPFASWFAIALPPLAFLCWPLIQRGTRYLLVGGLAIGLLFNLPFIFVVKSEQMHLVAAGASMMLAGAALAALQAVRLRLARAPAALVVAAGIAACAYVGRHISTDFEPYGPVVLAMDDIVDDWAAVPQEVRDYLKAKRQTTPEKRLSSNPVDELSTVAFGLHPNETSPTGFVYRWMAQPHVDLFLAAGLRHLTIPVRHDVGAFREPTSVVVAIDGEEVERLTLSDANWRVLRYALRPDAPTISRMHRLTIDVPHVWVPAKVIPGSNDGRPLGLQIGEISVR